MPARFLFFVNDVSDGGRLQKLNMNGRNQCDAITCFSNFRFTRKLGLTEVLSERGLTLCSSLCPHSSYIKDKDAFLQGNGDNGVGDGNRSEHTTRRLSSFRRTFLTPRPHLDFTSLLDM